MSEDQRDTDPLPYTQVDRAVRAKAAQLADLLDVTRQHALGGLAEFWDLCGDPRELERLLAQGEHEVVLGPDDVARRFRIALNKDADPRDLAVLGLLEPRGDAYRVRGMSRYFLPLERRLKRKASGSLGGRAKAANRYADARAPARAPARANANTADSGQRTAVISEKKLAGSRPSRAKRWIDSARRPDWKPTTDALCATFLEARGVPYAFQGAKDGAALSWLLAQAEPEEVLLRWRRGLRGVGWEKVNTVAQLRAKWNDLAPPASDIAGGSKLADDVFGGAA